MSESDTHSPRDEKSRELADEARVDGREYVLPTSAPQSRSAEGLNGHAVDAGHSSSRPQPSVAPSWRELFSLPSSSQILARVLDGDPLQVEDRCRARVDHLALLLDVERVVQCAMANIAYFGRRYRGSPPFELWMRQRVEAGIERVLEDEQESERTLMNFAPPSMVHLSLAHALGLDVHLARRASVVVNSLPLTVRRVFRAVVLQRQPIEALPDDPFGDALQRERRLRTALNSIAHLEPMEVHPDDGGLDDE